MCKSKRGQRLILIRKARKLIYNIYKLLSYKLKRLRHNDYIRVVTHITGSGSKMYDTLCFGALFAVGIHMAHYVMPYLLLTLSRHIVVDVIDVRLHFLYLLIRDLKSQLLLCFRKGYPQFPPCSEFHIG